MKKVSITMGAIAAAAAPIAAVVACGSAQHSSAFWAVNKQWSVSNAKAAHFDTKKLQELDEEFKKQIDAGFPGISILITKNGNEVFKHSYGYAQKVFDESTGFPNVDSTGHAVLTDKTKYRSMTDDTMFDLASNTKMYSANILAMAMASAEGMAQIKTKYSATLGNGIPVYDEHGAQKTQVTQGNANEAIVNGKVYDKTFDVERKIYEYMPEYIADSKYIDENSGAVTANGNMQDSTGTHLDKKTIRLVDMISHTGGYSPEILFFNRNIPSSQASDTNKPSFSRHIDGDNVTTPWQLNSNDPTLTKQLIVRKVGLTRSANGKHIYSDTDFMLLGIIIERIFNGALQESAAVQTHLQAIDSTTTVGKTVVASYKTLNDIAKNVIWDELGLTHTTFNPLKHGFQASQIAATAFQGNTRDGLLNTHYPVDMYPKANPEFMRRNVILGTVHDEKSFYTMGGVSGHAGLFSNTSDLAKMQRLLLSNGEYTKGGATKHLFNAATVTKFTSPVDSDPTYGIGWRKPTYWGFGSHPSSNTFGHSGWTGTWMINDPDADLTITYLTNKKHTKTNRPDGEHKYIYFNGDYMPVGRYDQVTNKIYECLVD